MAEEQQNELPESGLWRYREDTPEGKYLVKRRDGTIVEWPHFVLGARDPYAVAALIAYADKAESDGVNAAFVADIRHRLIPEFEAYREEKGNGDPGRGPHRKDDPATVELMKQGRSA